MKRFVKNSFVVLLSAIMVVGCGKASTTNAPTTDAKTTTPATTEAAKEPATPAEETKEEITNIKWMQLGDVPLNYDAWSKALNEYLGEKYALNADVEFIPFSDYDNRTTVMIQSGEYFDLMGTRVQNYLPNLKMGGFMDITELVKTAAPELYEYIPQDIWKASAVDNKYYAVPTYKDCAATLVMVWDKDLTDAVGVDINKITTFKETFEPLKKIHELTGQPSLLMDSGSKGIVINPIYDDMSTALPAFGVRYDDASRKVVFTLEQEDIMGDLITLHEMYKEGIINADAVTLKDSPSKKPFMIGQGWISAAKTIWGPNGDYNAEAVIMGEPIISNSTVRGSLNSVYSGSKNPEKSLEFLQVANLDTKVRDMLYYGLEGDDFSYTSDNKLKRNNLNWKVAGYAQATFFTLTPVEGEVDKNVELRELNEMAKPSTLLGFNLNTDSIETELANCRDVWSKYKSELLTGSVDPVEAVAKIKAEMEQAGFNKIIEEAQKQIDSTQFN